MNRLLLPSLLVVLNSVHSVSAKDPVFSGPQVGEKMPPFSSTYLGGESKGRKFDFIKEGKGKPTVVVFWHELGRPGFALVRALTAYAGEKKDNELRHALIVLSDDPEGANFKRVLSYFPKDLVIGVGQDGKTGPGAYGLNRNVKMTVLVANEDKVTANFALVQPSVQVDGPKILKAIAEVIGEEPPELEQLLERNKMNMRRMAGDKKV